MAQVVVSVATKHNGDATWGSNNIGLPRGTFCLPYKT